MAMMISWVMPVNPSHPYLENDPAPSFAPTICAFHLGFSLGQGARHPPGLFYVTERRLGIPGAISQSQSQKARVVSDSPGRGVPGAQECAFCDITKADCPERVEGIVPGEATTDDFRTVPDKHGTEEQFHRLPSDVDC